MTILKIQSPRTASIASSRVTNEFLQPPEDPAVDIDQPLKLLIDIPHGLPGPLA
jgi:hypothetical protein